MTGLVSVPASPVDPSGAAVVADGWFPPVTLASVRGSVRLGEGVVTTPRLTAAIEGAMLHAFRELADWRTARVLSGALNLAGTTTETLNGKNRAAVLWERIVRYFAAAELYEQHRDVSATDQGLDRAQEKSDTADEMRRLALAAVADLLSVGGDPVARNTVDLI